MQRHNFHLVTESPWPLLTSIVTLLLPISAVLYFHSYKFALNLLLISMLFVVLFMGIWWRDVIREGTYLGDHTLSVQKSLKIGMLLFILSEVLFFFSFFWAFLYCVWFPNVDLGGIWPPVGIIAPNPFGVPLVNTVILVWSGATITWAHYALLIDAKVDAIAGFVTTICLAIFFTFLQGYEYLNASFTLADGIYGTTFFVATGFHGLHVIIGTIFILVCLIRYLVGHFTVMHHLGFEFAAWYWHFVDVVWLLLFLIFYVWGSSERIYIFYEDMAYIWPLMVSTFH